MTLFQPLTKKLERNEIIKVVGSAESQSEHPLGAAVAEYAKESLNSNEMDAVADFEAVPGSGIKCSVTDKNGKKSTVLIGNRTWLHSNDIQLTKDVNKLMKEHEQLGKTAVLVGINGVLAAMIAISDQVKARVRHYTVRIRYKTAMHKR